MANPFSKKPSQLDARQAGFDAKRKRRADLYARAARAEQAEAYLDEAVKQITAMSDEMGKVEAECDEMRKALQALYGAEWMVTHDWGGDREAVMREVRTALGLDPETGEPLAKPNGEETGG